MTTRDRFVVLDLSSHFNNDAIAYATNLRDGGFNVWGNTYPAEALPPSLSVVDVLGVPFRFPPKEDGHLNNVVCAAQYVEVPEGRYDWIYVLAAAERCAEDVVYVHYADGAVDPEWLRISDFWPDSPARFGEVPAFRPPALNYPRHVQRDLSPIMWRQRVPVTRERPLVGFTLPENDAIHILAATVWRSPASPAT